MTKNQKKKLKNKLKKQLDQGEEPEQKNQGNKTSRDTTEPMKDEKAKEVNIEVSSDEE